MTASLFGHTDFAKLLLDRGADINLNCTDGTNALFLASMNGYTDIVSMLLAKGARPDSREDDGANALIINADDQIAEMITSKLYRRSDQESGYSEQLTAMVATSLTGQLQAVKLSSESNADPAMLAKAEKTTAFIRASGSGRIAIVKLMLKKDARFNIQNKARFTDLMVASMNGHTEVVKTLLENGANPGLRDNENKTALDHAGNPDIRRLLAR